MISVDIKLLTSPASDNICLTLVDEISLVGDAQRIREQAKKWQALEAEGLISTMIFTDLQPEALPLLVDIFK